MDWFQNVSIMFISSFPGGFGLSLPLTQCPCCFLGHWWLAFLLFLSQYSKGLDLKPCLYFLHTLTESCGSDEALSVSGAALNLSRWLRFGLFLFVNVIKKRQCKRWNFVTIWVLCESYDQIEMRFLVKWNYCLPWTSVKSHMYKLLLLSVWKLKSNLKVTNV